LTLQYFSLVRKIPVGHLTRCGVDTTTVEFVDSL